jgi:hypothetical protein
MMPVYQDPSILFIVIRAKSVDVIQKAVLVAESTKRLRHTRWQEVVGDDEIHQYVQSLTIMMLESRLTLVHLA